MVDIAGATQDPESVFTLPKLPATIDRPRLLEMLTELGLPLLDTASLAVHANAVEVSLYATRVGEGRVPNRFQRYIYDNQNVAVHRVFIPLVGEWKLPPKVSLVKSAAPE